MYPATKDFIKLAKTRWGRRWRPKLAAALDVHPVTVWRWTREDALPPKSALIALRQICNSVDA